MSEAAFSRIERELDDVRKRLAQVEKEVAAITAKAPVFIRGSIASVAMGSYPNSPYRVDTTLVNPMDGAVSARCEKA